MIEVQVTLTITSQQIADLVCSGIEGDMSPQWLKAFRCKSEYSGEDIWYADPKFWESENFVVTAFPEDKEFPARKLNLDDVKRALRTMAEEHPTHFSDFMEDNCDAITGDVFIQLLVLEKVVYG